MKIKRSKTGVHQSIYLPRDVIFPSRSRMPTCTRVSKCDSGTKLVDSLENLCIVEVSHWRTWLDGVLGMDSAVKPRVVVCVSGQSRHEIAVGAFPPMSDSQTRGGTALVAIQPSHSRLQVEAIKDSKPCGHDLRPPRRHHNLVLLMARYDEFLVAGHPSRSELVQKWTLRFECGIEESHVAAANVKLA